MSYTDTELIKAKDILESCNFVSSSTKGCYSSRIALWIHFCNERCGGDERVTEERLADYVEWMVSSGSAERIRQGTTHVQQVLRNQLQGVLCYWRIQNGNRADLPDPRMGHLFMAKWQQIAMRFPRPRPSRRSEPIYGVPGPSQGGSEMKSEYGAHSEYPQKSGVPAEGGHPMALRQGIPSPMSQVHQRHRYAQMKSEHHQPYPGHTQQPAYTGMPEQAYPSPSGPRYPPKPLGLSPPLLPQPQRLPTSLPDALPVQPVQLNRYTSKPSFPSFAQPAMSRQESPEPAAASHAHSIASITSIDSRLSIPTDDEESRHSGTDYVPDAAESPRPTFTASGSPQIDAANTMVSNTPKILVAKVDVLKGVVPDTIPVWEPSKEFKPEGNLLSLNEALALSAQQLDACFGIQSQARADRTLGLATWLSAEARARLTFTDVAIDEIPAAASTAAAAAAAVAQQQEGAQPSTPMSANSSSSADRSAGSPKRLTFAVHSADKTTADDESKPGKTAVLRHSNPLLCAWSALALELFRRWHVAKEAIPDFGTPEWQSLKLFPDLAEDASSANSVDEIHRHAFAELSNDSVQGSLAMTDAGYFYADAFGLVRPTAAATKGLACVDPINSAVLLPQVFDILVRVNAGHSADSAESLKTSQRFGIAPPQSLQKEVFPWIRPLLLNAFGQSSNNEDVRSATRFLRLLKELRVVLLQDVAILMEIPSLKSILGTNALFAHSLFTSDDFTAYREQVRSALAETEIKELEEQLAGALSWASQYKADHPEGNAARLTPTAPRMPTPEPPAKVLESSTAPEVAPKAAEANAVPDAAVDADGDVVIDDSLNSVQKPVSVPNSSSRTQTPLPSTDSEVGQKRLRTESLAMDGGTEYSPEPGSDSASAAYPGKRYRRVYNVIANSQTNANNRGETGGVFGPISKDQNASGDERSSPNVSSALDELRMENDDLRSQLRRIEFILGQQRAEVTTWMGKMEKVMHSLVQSARRSASPPADKPAATGGHAMPGQGHQSNGAGMPSAAMGHRGPSHPTQLSQPASSAPTPPIYNNRHPRVYSESRYAQPHGFSPNANKPGTQEGYSKYESASEAMRRPPQSNPSMEHAGLGRPGLAPHMRNIAPHPSQRPSQPAGGPPNGMGPARLQQHPSQFSSPTEYGEYNRAPQHGLSVASQQGYAQRMRYPQFTPNNGERGDPRMEKHWYANHPEQGYSSKRSSPHVPNGPPNGY